MYSKILSFFTSTKNIILAIFSILGGLYIARQKYKAYQAESKLKNIENQIAKNNVKIAKKNAKAKADAKEIETESEINSIRNLNKEKEKVHKEMEEIEKEIKKAKDGDKIKVQI